MKQLFYLLILVGIGIPALANDGGIEKIYFSRLTGLVAMPNSQPLVPGATAILTYTPDFEKSKAIKNIITLSVIEEANAFVPQNFTASVKLKVEYGHSANQLTIIPDLVLSITFDKANGTKFNAKNYFTFDSAEYVKITVLQITAPVLGTLDTRKVLQIQNEMRATRYYDLLPNVQPSSFTAVVNATDAYTVNWAWPANAGNNYTQLEWVWLEDELAANYMVNNVLDYTLLFKNNATRIDLPLAQNSYTIPLLYDGTGKLYYRIRAVNIKKTGRADGPWAAVKSYAFIGHDNNLNWQASTSFAEEGKRKSVVQYFDGSLRNRQTVTKDNSTNTTVVAETFYDGEGRPAIQILPAPGMNSVLKYQANLNLFNGQNANEDPAKYFDLQPINIIGSGTPPLKTISGTAQYYSAANPEANVGMNKFIPDANGYPYTVTRYTPDGSGRIMSQSGVGDSMKMGSTHETKYYYGTASQEELDGLFGTEAGNFTHYFKNMVKDGNGQMSVSLSDMHGRTIATALAGDAPANVTALNLNDYPKQAGTSITRNLLDNGSNLVKNNSIIESVNTILVPATTNYQFNYELNPQTLQLATCTPNVSICYDCLYDLEISITDESGDAAPIIKKFTNVTLVPDDACATAVPKFKDANNVLSNIIMFNQLLAPGSYAVRKTLTISEASFQKYKDQYLAKALCKTKQQVIDSVYNVMITASGCNAAVIPVTCQSCVTALGPYATYKAAFLVALGSPAITPALDSSIKNNYRSDSLKCTALCTNKSQLLSIKRQMMLADMMPYTGQYAIDPTIVNYQGILTSSAMYKKYDIFSLLYPNTGQPFYKKPLKADSTNGLYYDLDGQVDATIHPDPLPNQYVKLSKASRADFEQAFKNKWAEALLPYHPEYKKLIFAETKLTPSYDWINNFAQTSTYAQAQANNYIITSDANISADPFYNLGIFILGHKAEMVKWVSNQYRQIDNVTWVTMWQMAYGNVKCKSIVNETARKMCYTAAPKFPPYADIVTAEEKDQLWQAFQGLYMAERDIHVNKYITASTAVIPAQTLINDHYILHFPESNNQTAQQYNSNGDWNWYPPTPNTPPNIPPVIPGDPNSDPYASKCQSYIESWKQALLQCPAIANHASKNLILTQITDGMKEVCLKGSNPANPNGSSNVAPQTPQDGKPRSFEEVINAVLAQYAIAKTDYCNPFVIEFPKPYGKGPKFVNEMTVAVDSCNCVQFAKMQTEAQAKGYNPLLLPSLNQYLKSQYGDTLTVGLFNGLQHCSELKFDDGCPPKLTCLYAQPGPNDGYDVSVLSPAFKILPYLSPALSTYSYTNNVQDLFVARSLLKFDLSSIPANATIYSGRLSLYSIPGNDLIGNNASYVQRVTSNWVQNIVTWQTQPSTTEQNQSTIPASGEVNQNYPAIDVTALLKDIMGSTNYGFMIRLVNEDGSNNYMNFASSNNTNPALRPMLEVCYKACNAVPKILYYPLPQPQPLPEFLKCGFTGNAFCVNCAQLSSLTAEFKTALPAPYNAGPVFTGVNLTADQVVKNSSYARFINYRTGMQYSWMEYAKAAAAAMPACNLANYAANANAFQNVICGDAKALNDTVGLYKKNPPCQQVYNMSVSLGEQVYEKQKETLLGTLEGQYRVKCLAAKAIEKFSVTYTNKEYHYTLYYYDMAGSLVKTVPPKGARPDFTTAFTNSVKAARVNNQIVVPPHILATNYRYNSLGQVMAQHTPDAGLSNFWYDKLGRLAVSQNAQQKIGNKYSYTLYDFLGRINEVGQKPQAVNSMSQAVSQDPVALNNWVNVNGGVKEQITQTVYDQPYAPFIIPDPLITQKNLRNRVSYTTFKNLANEGLHYTGTFYTYDVHGNVDTLLQDYVGIAAMNSSSNRFKLMAYDYDLISGKVNMVSYQPKGIDAFYHKYYYDAENRITSVESSRDKIVWERDAAYNYYKHGPLARMVLGQNQVQGLDYAYTVQGWLKGVNSTTVFSPLQGTGWGFDMGADGGGVNKQVAADVFGFSLNYYNNDYKAINAAAKPFAAVTNAVGLFNGNIAAMAVNLPKIGEPLLYQYRYDQLNRLLKMSASKGLNNVNNTWTPVVLNDYAEDIVYDPNGNILTYKRNGSAAKLDMDKMTYQYPKDALGNALNNRLRYVHDEVAAANYAEDIDSQTALTLAQVQAQKLPEQLTDNYGYDAIGNLIKDTKEGISSIKWNVYGKIESITKMGNTINYSYDAAGNRISKIIGTKSTFYVRDASGNVMSVYSIDPLVNQGKILQSEVHLYGSSRLGLVNALTVAPQIKPVAAGFGTGILSTFTRGEKFFELSNHLGNVLATVSDKKIAYSLSQMCDGDNNCVDLVSGYTADVLSAGDYYSGGMSMNGRKFNSSKLINGFNGKRYDNEVYGEGNFQDYGLRVYDPRVVRFLSVDPLTKGYPYYSPYQFAGNNPIAFIDLDGGEPKEPTKPGTAEGQSESTSDNKFVPSPTARGGTWQTTTTNWSWHTGGIESLNGSKSKAGWYDSKGYADALTPVAKELAIEAKMTNGASNIQLADYKKGSLEKFVGTGLSANTTNHLLGQAQFLANQANASVTGYIHASSFNVEDMLGVGLLFKGGMKLLGGMAARNIAAKEGSNTMALAKYWPSNEGALGKWSNIMAKEGQIMDRYGSIYGTYASPVGTPFNMRALSPTTNPADYFQFQVLKPFPIQTSNVAPAFGKIGLGVQYKTPIGINSLEELGYIKILK